MTPALCRITVSAESAMMYGTTLVTTARFTSAPNCDARSGEIVISASSVCTTPMMTMPVIGAPIEFDLAEEGREHPLVGRVLRGLMRA